MNQSFDQKRHPGALSPSSSSRNAHSNQEQDPAGWSVLTGLRLKQIAPVAPHQLKKFSDDNALLGRVLPNLIVILLVALAIDLSKMEWAWERSGTIRPLKPTLKKSAATPAIAQSEAPLILPAQLDRTRNDIIFLAGVPHTIIPERTRAEIVTYQVETGDTVSSIAAKFGLSPETIVWANRDLERNPDLLGLGQVLVVLPVNGVYHQMGGGDTIESIAASYQVESTAIVNYALNQIEPDEPVIQSGSGSLCRAAAKLTPRAPSQSMPAHCPKAPRQAPTRLIGRPGGRSFWTLLTGWVRQWPPQTPVLSSLGVEMIPATVTRLCLIAAMPIKPCIRTCKPTM